MSDPSNGITPEVIRQIMPPYQLNPDLLQATLAALPRPPQDATQAWREARVARLIQEISERMPANAAQARTVTESLIFRELATTLATLALTPDTELPMVCRLARTANAVMHTAVTLDRSLTRQQQKPAPFFGTVLSDQVDVPALAATWHATPDHRPQPTPRPPPRPPRQPQPRPIRPTRPRHPTPPHRRRSSPRPSPRRTPIARPSRPRPPASQPTPPPEWSFTKIDEGPGWSREVLRHRSSTATGIAATPEPAE